MSLIPRRLGSVPLLAKVQLPGTRAASRYPPPSVAALQLSFCGSARRHRSLSRKQAAGCGPELAQGPSWASGQQTAARAHTLSRGACPHHGPWAAGLRHAHPTASHPGTTVMRLPLTAGRSAATGDLAVGQGTTDGGKPASPAGEAAGQPAQQRSARPVLAGRGPDRGSGPAAALADLAAAAGRAGAAGAGDDRLPARPALHRQPQVHLRRLAGQRPAGLQRDPQDRAGAGQPDRGHRATAPGRPGHGGDPVRGAAAPRRAALAGRAGRRASAARRVRDPDRADHHAQRVVRGLHRGRAGAAAVAAPPRAPADRWRAAWCWA